MDGHGGDPVGRSLPSEGPKGGEIGIQGNECDSKLAMEDAESNKGTEAMFEANGGPESENVQDVDKEQGPDIQVDLTEMNVSDGLLLRRNDKYDDYILFLIFFLFLFLVIYAYNFFYMSLTSDITVFSQSAQICSQFLLKFTIWEIA